MEQRDNNKWDGRNVVRSMHQVLLVTGAFSWLNNKRGTDKGQKMKMSLK